MIYILIINNLIDYFNKYGYIIKEGLMPRLDYLKILDKKGVLDEK